MGSEDDGALPTDYSLEATYFRTALLLGMVRGVAVHHWAGEVIERDADPPSAFFEIVSVAATDLSALRHALWPLVVEPEPRSVVERLFARLHADLGSGERSSTETVQILRQMRSMVRMPRDLYDAMNAALAAHATRSDQGVLPRWLQDFAPNDGSPESTT